MNHGGHGDTEENVRTEMMRIEGIEGVLFHLMAVFSPYLEASAHATRSHGGPWERGKEPPMNTDEH